LGSAAQGDAILTVTAIDGVCAFVRTRIFGTVKVIAIAKVDFVIAGICGHGVIVVRASGQVAAAVRVVIACLSGVIVTLGDKRAAESMSFLGFSFGRRLIEPRPFAEGWV